MPKCAALLISAPASNQGKTTITAGIAYAQKRRGKKVRIFKTGPDFLDPKILERASGHPVYQLDLWMLGEDGCRQLLFEAAEDADLILIEGVMGLFDGQPSSADLAERLAIPILIIIDASSMAQTLAAVAQGLINFRPSLCFTGVIANKVASAKHAQMVNAAMIDNVSYLGAVERDSHLAIPSRHLGLVQAEEIEDIETRLAAIADRLEGLAIERATRNVDFVKAANSNQPSLLTGVRIAVAKDMAFSFLYEANLDLLRQLGARLTFFSPLKDRCLPEADSVYLPGGYPELYLRELENNKEMKLALKHHFDNYLPIYAECGGMLYLLDSLTDKEGSLAQMTGLIPGYATMQKHLASLGYQSALFPEGELRGHTFHYSSLNVDIEPIGMARRQYDHSTGEPIYKLKRLVASYLHFYFPSNPHAIASIFNPS